ncbi:NAD-dependent epimerase/dehydratase family protein [Paenibacillus sepulcri]
MHILVTGATGRVGSRLVRRLLERGDKVRILVRSRQTAQPLQELGAEVAVGDLQQPDTLADAVRDVEAVIHLAAFFRGASEAEMKAVNTAGTLALAHAAVQAGVKRFVFASTNLVYEGLEGRALREDDRFTPAFPYPASKIEAEQALMELHRTHGLGLRIIRLAFVYGDGDPHLEEGMRWFGQWHPAKRIHMIHHADAAQAMMLAADRTGIDGRIYNAADLEPAAAADIIALLGKKLDEGAYERTLERPWEHIVDVSRIQSELGYMPVFPSLAKAAEAGVL